MNVFDLFKQILNDDGGNTFPFLSSSTLLPSVSEMTTSSIQPTTSTTTTTTTMLPSTSMTMRKSIQPHVPDVSISTTTMVPSSPTSIQPVPISGGVTPMRKSSNQHDHDTNMLPTPISSSVSISTSNTLKEEFPLPKRRRGSTNHDFNTVLEFQCLECDFHTQDREIIREHCKRGNQA